MTVLFVHSDVAFGPTCIKSMLVHLCDVMYAHNLLTYYTS